MGNSLSGNGKQPVQGMGNGNQAILDMGNRNYIF